MNGHAYTTRETEHSLPYFFGKRDNYGYCNITKIEWTITLGRYCPNYAQGPGRRLDFHGGPPILDRARTSGRSATVNF